MTGVNQMTAHRCANIADSNESKLHDELPYADCGLRLNAVELS
jgi:hypothetical protein